MKKMKYITTGLALCGILAGLTGCGLANTSEVSVTGRVTSGSAVELPDVTRNMEKSRYANSDNVYSSSYWSDTEEEDLSILIQMKPDGSVVDKIKIKNLSDVVWVTDEWIYYSTDNNQSKMALCRIPVEKTDSGDKLKVEESEKLFEVDGEIGDQLVVTEDSIFYDCSDDHYDYCDDHLCRYDFDSGESIVLLEEEDGDSLICFHGEDEYHRALWPVMTGDHLIIRTEDREDISELYTLDLKSSELKSFYSGLSMDSWLDIIAQNGDNIYFVPDKKRQQIYCFDGEKTECVLKQGELMEKVPELNLPVEGEISIVNMFFYQNRLYLFVTLTSEQDRPDSDIIMQASFLLSAPVDDLTQIRHEEKVTDYMKKEKNSIFFYEDSQGKIRNGEKEKKVETVVESYYSLTGPMDLRVVFDRKVILQGRNYTSQLSGVAYASFDYAVYDLETGEIEETEMGKVMQQSDDRKVVESFALPWKAPWEERDS